MARISYSERRGKYGHGFPRLRFQRHHDPRRRRLRGVYLFDEEKVRLLAGKVDGASNGAICGRVLLGCWIFVEDRYLFAWKNGKRDIRMDVSYAVV